jgi:two-component system, OmpR family, phosphate regulon sensor histidine kinase PhoR
LNGITQGKIAFTISIFLLFFQWFSLLFYYYLVAKFPPFIFIIPLVSSVLIFFLILTLIEYFILRKIRILYRTFLSIGKKIDRKSIQDPELFEKLSLQLEQYRIEKSIEIDRLKENELFRKEFISNVSHELKTPLTSIQGFVELLISAVKSNEKIELNYLEKIYKNSDRLIDIVQDLTTISQAEHRQLNLKLEKFDIYSLFEDVIDSIDEMAKIKKIKIEFKDINITALWVKADRAKMSQVIFNLLENAIYYCPEKSKIQIRLTEMDQHILIEIIDNGPGISAEHLPRIFERFYRIDENRSREKGGSGLGLSIVKNILEAHEQPIHVESLINKGTKFFFSLARA